MQHFPAFILSRLPRIVFGAGCFDQLAPETARLGRHALVVTGARSFRAGPHWPRLMQALAANNIAVESLAVAGEPTAELVDNAVTAFKGAGVDVVVGLGGGSALDAAKAIAGLLPSGASVMDHLEIVGRGIPYHGPALPLIAVPTTAGTGCEATRNAVISRIGPDGFKRSFRHDALMPALALVDPALLDGAPRAVLAANGMDALTQLMESFTSTRANALTDGLAWAGLEAVAEGFMAALDGNPAGQARMAFAAMVSGICLAHTGLGAVHGLASPLGAAFPIPHGTVCGTLVAAVTQANIAALRERDPLGPALPKYRRLGTLLGGGDGLDTLEATLQRWVDALAMPRLSGFGMTEADIPGIVAASGGTSMQTNPLVLSEAELSAILRQRL